MYDIIFSYIISQHLFIFISGRHNPVWGVFGAAIYFGLSISDATGRILNINEFAGIVINFAIGIFISLLIAISIPKIDIRKTAKRSSINFGILGYIIFSTMLTFFIIFDIYLFFSLDGMHRHIAITGFFAHYWALCIATSYFFFFEKRRKSSQPIETNQPKKTQILFLRSFNNDLMTLPDSISYPMEYFPWSEGYLNKHFGVSFDEIIAEKMQKLHSFIAVGNPNDFLPAPGSQKIYFDDTSWKTAIQPIIHQSNLVIVSEGVTEGVRWELEYLKNAIDPKRIVIVTYPENYRNAFHIGKYWKTLVEYLNSIGYNIEINDPGSNAIITFGNDWNSAIYYYKDIDELVGYLNLFADGIPREVIERKDRNAVLGYNNQQLPLRVSNNPIIPPAVGKFSLIGLAVIFLIIIFFIKPIIPIIILILYICFEVYRKNREKKRLDKDFTKTDNP